MKKIIILPIFFWKNYGRVAPFQPILLATRTPSYDIAKLFSCLCGLTGLAAFVYNIFRLADLLS